MKKIISTVMMVLMVISMSAVSFAGSQITSKEALRIALKDAHLTRAKVTKVENEYEHGKYEVEFTKKSNKAEYDYEIGRTGRILEKSVDYRYKKDHSRKKIGKAAARKKAAKVTGVSLKVVKKGSCRYEYDDDDRKGKYEVKFKKGHYKYEVEILAPTGAIMEYDKEYRK